jgi:two-component system sensor kinase FixL
MGQMAATLAHELNQPLTAVTNYCQAMRRMLAGEAEPDLSRLREAVELSAGQALRAGQIIRRLRDFVAKGEAERTIESLPKLLEEAGALAMLGAKDRGVRLRFALDSEVDLVLADKVQVQQVALNLVRNAIEAMDASPQKDLLVSARAVDDGMAEVAVADTGPGISPEVAEQLFQPFITTKADGMGVGLSISRTIIEAHGGRIWVEDNPGGGAIFRFTLRRAPDEGEMVEGE